MAIKLVSRSAWGARLARSGATHLASTRGVKVHYTGDYIARAGPPTPEPPGDDDVPEYVSVGTAGDQQLPPGEWVTVYWDKEYSDPSRQHRDAGGLSILAGPAMYSLTAALVIEGLSPGAVGQIRTVEVLAEDTSRYEPGPIQEFGARDGALEVLYGVPADAIGGNRWLRIQVIQHGDGAADLAGGSSAKLLFWR